MILFLCLQSVPAGPSSTRYMQNGTRFGSRSFTRICQNQRYASFMRLCVWFLELWLNCALELLCDEFLDSVSLNCLNESLCLLAVLVACVYYDYVYICLSSF